MNITHDNDIPIPTRLDKMRAITVIKSGDFIVIKDRHHDDWIGLAQKEGDFRNDAMMYINKKGIKIECFAEISSTEVIFLTTNFDIRM